MANFKDTRVSEKRFYAIPEQALTADGTTDGTITVASTYCWKVGQTLICQSSAVEPRQLKIKAILSDTIIKVGDLNTPIFKFVDVSELLVADGATISLADDNNGNRRPVIDLNEIRRQVYEEEPTVALRVHQVDWLGRSFSRENPVPVQVSDYEKLFPLLTNANWMNLADFEAVNPVFSGDTATLEYKQDGATIGRGIFRYVNDEDWDLTLEKYINDADGSIIQDDDDTDLFLD